MCEIIGSKDPWNSNTFTKMRGSVNENKLGDSDRSVFKMRSSRNPDWSRVMRQKLSPICFNKETKSGVVCYSFVHKGGTRHSKTLLRV